MKLDIPSAEPKDVATLHRWLLEAFRRSGDSYGGRTVLRVPVGVNETRIAHGQNEQPLAVFWSTDGIVRVGRTRVQDDRFVYLRASVPTIVDLLVIPGPGVQSSAAVNPNDTIDPAIGLNDDDGSVFSMVPPLGAPEPIVVYDFCNFYNNAATDAANILAANRSGNSDLDLARIGTPATRFLTNTGSANQVPFGLTPAAMGTGGGALFSAGVANYVESVSAVSELRFLAGMTMEWYGYITVIPTVGTGDIQFINFEGPASGETEAENILYLLQWEDLTNNLRYVHESGAGANSTAGLFTMAETLFTSSISLPVLFTLTRSGAGMVTLYVNGRLAAPPVTPGPTSALPTGGTSSRLRISQVINTGATLATLAVRLFGATLSAAQVRESYNRTMFGKATP